MMVLWTCFGEQTKRFTRWLALWAALAVLFTLLDEVLIPETFAIYMMSAIDVHMRIIFFVLCVDIFCALLTMFKIVGELGVLQRKLFGRK